MIRVQPSTDKDSFAGNVKEHFSFLETEFAMSFSGVRETNGDARDRGFIATYADDETRIQIGWNELELSLCVVIRTKTADLPKKKQWVYFEPFIEFVTNAKCRPIVPQIYYRMSGKAAGKALNARKECFRKGLSDVLMAVADRLRHHLTKVKEASCEVILAYHDWFDRGGGSQK